MEREGDRLFRGSGVEADDQMKRERREERKSGSVCQVGSKL